MWTENKTALLFVILTSLSYSNVRGLRLSYWSNYLYPDRSDTSETCRRHRPKPHCSRPPRLPETLPKTPQRHSLLDPPETRSGNSPGSDEGDVEPRCRKKSENASYPRAPCLPERAHTNLLFDMLTSLGYLNVRGLGPPHFSRYLYGENRQCGGSYLLHRESSGRRHRLRRRKGTDGRWYHRSGRGPQARSRTTRTRTDRRRTRRDPHRSGTSRRTKLDALRPNR